MWQVPVVSGVQRYCSWGTHWVDVKDAAEVYATTVMSGPELPVYACWTHVYEHNLGTVQQPVEREPRGPLIGRRHVAPMLPGRTP